MRTFLRTAVTVAGYTALCLSLSSCGWVDGRSSRSRPMASAPVPLPAPLPNSGRQFAAPAALEQGDAAVWNLRAGLNVAALMCRGGGRQDVAGQYRQLLSRHENLFAAAYRGEQQRLSVAAFDSQQTRLYNRFSNQRSPERFCMAAAQVAERANALSSANLAMAAPQLLASLDMQRTALR